MGTNVKPIQEGYYAMTPYLCVKERASAIGFYQRFFGAKEVMRMPGHMEPWIGFAATGATVWKIPLRMSGMWQLTEKTSRRKR